MTDSDEPTIDDVAWLVGPEGDRCLQELAGLENTAATDKKLFQFARRLGNARASLLSMIWHSRQRGKRKFEYADRMFFTPTALEQATDSILAEYKAARFPRDARLADLCCGIGGDLVAMAQVGQVSGVELDPLVAEFAAANAKALGKECEVLQGRAEDFPLASVAAWHIDPDRRASGKRTTDVDQMQPDMATIAQMLAKNPNAAIKLAPATSLPEAWAANCQLEWLGWNRECQQQVAWFGALRKEEADRMATVVSPTGPEGELTAQSIQGNGAEPIPFAAGLGKYVYEPVAPVLAAHLTGALAARENCAVLAPGIVYLTSDEWRSTRLMQGFQVMEEMAFDRRKLKARLRELRMGRLEIKVRGVDESPEKIRKQLEVEGERAGVILIYRGRGGVRAIVAERT